MTILVGISGPSGSGKSTVAHKLIDAFPGSVHLQQDLFFVDPDLCDAASNFCDPAFMMREEFTQCVQMLRAGQDVAVPVVDFSTFRRIGNTETLRVAGAPLAIVEGMTVFRDATVMGALDVRYYLAPPFDVVHRRKRERDLRERGKTRSEFQTQMKWVESELISDLTALEVGGAWHGTVTPIRSADTSAAVEYLRQDLQRRLDSLV